MVKYETMKRPIGVNQHMNCSVLTDKDGRFRAALSAKRRCPRRVEELFRLVRIRGRFGIGRVMCKGRHETSYRPNAFKRDDVPACLEHQVNTGNENPLAIILIFSAS